MRVNLNYANVAGALLTPRNIGGSPFDGTADVTFFPSPGPIGGGTPDVGAFTALSATDTITSTAGANSTVLTNLSAGTGWVQGISLSNTGGACTFGIENSVGGGRVTGSSAYDSFYSGGPLSFSANSGTNLHMRLSPAGLAVTGFGCNGKTPQTAAASGGLLLGVIAALVANGILAS